MTIEKYDDVKVIFFETGDHHPDNKRFIEDCEKWFDHPIITIQNPKYDSIYDVFKKERFINSAYGAPCTKHLKKLMRKRFEKHNPFTFQVFGFEYEKREIMRADRFSKEYPHTNATYPLIENKMNKVDCLEVLNEVGIELPMMYRLGYLNNNCIGCVKGGMGYWNKIRVDFPLIFDKMAALERELNASCINGVFLDELDPTRGRNQPPIVDACGIFCEEGIQ
tara:strand:+ start:67 stop:732 length:666 start_codon:yes stop_codon:yes gene_type:complete